MTRKQMIGAMVALLLANFIGGLDTTMLNTALPQIMRDLNGVNQLGLLTSILLFFVALTTVIWGKIGEIIGNKRAFQIATLTFIIASMVGGFSWNIWVMVVARGFMGIGIGGMVSIPYIIYAKLFPKSKERVAALGWVTAFFNVASIIGPIVGGLVVDWLGWSWNFFILVPFAVLSVILLEIFYKEEKVSASSRSFDGKGIALLAATSSILLYWIENLAHLSLPIHALIVLVVIGLLVTLWRVEHKVADPILPPTLLQNTAYLSKNMLMVLVTAFTIGYDIYAPIWSQNVLGTNASLAGATMIASSAAVILATRLTAPLLGKFSFKRMISLGYISLFTSVAMMALAPASASYAYIVISGAFMGLGQGLIFPPAQVAFQDDVPKSQLNISTTFSLLMRTLGQTFMASIYGLIYASQFAASGQAYPGLHLIFMVAFVLVGLGLVLNQFSWQKS